jgi:hypothetical protein
LIAEQATESFYLEMKKTGFHLQDGIPEDYTGLSHFVEEGGWLPSRCFNYDDPGNFRYAIPAMLSWASVDKWIHDPSGTVTAGPYGCKWAVLTLLNIQVSIAMYDAGTRPPYNDVYECDFTDRDRRQLKAAVLAWDKTFLESFAILYASREERLAGNSDFAHELDWRSTKGNIEMVSYKVKSEWEVRTDVSPSAYH